MSSKQLDEEEIFHLARRIEDPDARAIYLAQVCADDSTVRNRVEALLEAHYQDKRLLESAPVIPDTEDVPDLGIDAGHQIGRYKLLQRIGEGGMGTVFMAEQTYLQAGRRRACS